MEQSWIVILRALVEAKQIQYKSPEGYFDISSETALRSILNGHINFLRVKPENEEK
jgi:hypothetical protein